MPTPTLRIHKASLGVREIATLSFSSVDASKVYQLSSPSSRRRFPIQRNIESAFTPYLAGAVPKVSRNAAMKPLLVR